MSDNKLVLDSNRHKAFLAEQRKDPITHEPLRVGDEIVICANDKYAFLAENWQGECPLCHHSETLSEVPSRNFPNHLGPEPPKETLKSGHRYFRFLIILLLVICSIFLIYLKPNIIQSIKSVVFTDSSVSEQNMYHNKIKEKEINSSKKKKQTVVHKKTPGAQKYYKRGIKSFEEGEYLTTTRYLKKALESGDLEKSNKLKTHLYLGIAFVALDRTDKAKEQFRELLKIDPGHEINDLTKYSPKVIEIFNEVKREKFY